MNAVLPLIGFDRYVELEWLRSSFDVSVVNTSPQELRDLVSLSLPGPESQRKTLDVIKRISTKPFPQLTDFISRGMDIYKSAGNASALPIAWGGAIASYPFFGKTAETTGRLLRLQGDCSIKEIQRRMAESYGDRNGIERAVARVLQSQAQWGVFERDPEGKRIILTSTTSIYTDALITWLIEAAVLYTGKSISISSLQTLAVLFPFTLPESLTYLVSKSPNLMLRSEGPSNQFVTLRQKV